ncbi:MAG: glycosyltransferase [Cyanobacteria bacterium P01_A01_bin.3]
MSAGIKVGVSIITYNQEDFIAEAIDSVLMQIADFAFQIVIGDDNSTDSTPKILERYRENHPDRIRIVSHTQNVGAAQNMLDTLSECEGEYIALLDGDDYWTSPHKLQKLVAVLDAHLKCPMCFHNTQLIFQNGTQPHDFWPPKSQSFFNTTELLRDSGAISSATLWRRDTLLHAVAETKAVIIGDKARAIVASQFGDIGYVAETMSVWRIHQAGSFSNGNQQNIENNIRKSTAWFQFYQFIDEYFSGTYNAVLIPDMILQHYVMFKAYLRKGEFKACIYHLSSMFFSRANLGTREISSIFVPFLVMLKLLAVDLMRMPAMSMKLIRAFR